MKTYWYFDNWSGAKREFNSLRSAVKAARKEDGLSISIFNREGVARVVNANGFVHS